MGVYASLHNIPILAQGTRGINSFPFAPADSLAGAPAIPAQLKVEVTPHELHFDPTTKTAILTFHNAGSRPTQADVQTVFGYLDWPHGLPADTTLFTEHWERIFPHDTVIATPGPKDRFAGRWLSGVPAHVTLKPHETKQVTVRINPPADVAAGEYTARILVIVRPIDLRHGKNLDVQKKYALPTKGRSPIPMLRDSTLVTYRQGPLMMGLQVLPGAVGEIDAKHLPVPPTMGAGEHRLWYRFALHLTGNIPFVGVSHTIIRNVVTGEEDDLGSWEFRLYHDAVIHIWAQADFLGQGKYELIKTLSSSQEDLPVAQRIPVTPVRVVIPFEVKPAWAY